MLKLLLSAIVAFTVVGVAGHSNAQNPPNKPVLTAAEPGPSTAAAGPSAPVTAQWRSKLSFNQKESDRHTCLGTTPVAYTFVLVGAQLVIDTGSTKTTAVVGQGGSVDHSFWSNKGNNLRVLGNAQTKSFKVLLYNGRCVWDALPS